MTLSQENAKEKPLEYAEVIEKIKDKSIPFAKKYDLSIRHLRPDEQLDINKRLVSSARKEIDKAYLIKLYSNIYVLSNSLNKGLDDNKLYLDSALLYVDDVKDKIVLGKLYYTVGNYYLDRKEETSAHQYYRKALEVCENENGAELVILNTLYCIGTTYLWRQDAKSIKECVDKMLDITAKIKTTESYLITFPVVGAYYRIKANDPAIDDNTYYSYIDSVYKYDKKAVEVYESGDDHLKAAYAAKANTYYNNLVETASIRQNSDLVEVLQTLEKAAEFVPVSDTLAIHRNYHGKARVLFNQRKFDESLAASLEVLKILEKHSQPLYQCFYDTYSMLAETYEQKEDYKNAWRYEQKRNDAIKKMYELERYETIKELETKYQTAEKELEINKLNEQKQQLKYDRTVILALSLFAIILLVLGLLFSRIKTLKKEKQAILLANTIEQKEKDYQILLQESQQKITEQYIAGLESERSRLAKELHDGIANDLLGIVMLINNGADRQLITGKLNEAYSDVRNMSHRLIPPILTDVTLADVLEDFVRKQNFMSPAKVELDISFEEDWHSLPANYALEAYRIIQEAANNAIKHSDATKIYIEASYANDTLSGCVEDNGEGFDIHSKMNGMGLKSMKDRANRMKANLEIFSATGKGTKISFRFNTLSS